MNRQIWQFNLSILGCAVLPSVYGSSPRNIDQLLVVKMVSSHATQPVIFAFPFSSASTDCHWSKRHRWGERSQRRVSLRKSYFKWCTPEMRKAGSKNTAFNLKWADLHVHFTCWEFKICLKETQVITEGINVKQKPDNTTKSSAS